MKDKFGIKGRVEASLFDEHGALKDKRILENTVTELGDAHVADAMSDAGEGALGFMAVGTGTGQTSASTGLATSLDRNTLTSTAQRAGAADNEVMYYGDWAAGDGTGAITEAGIFLADNNTSMNYYADFLAINKGALDTLQIVWIVTFGAS